MSEIMESDTMDQYIVYIYSLATAGLKTQPSCLHFGLTKYRILQMESKSKLLHH